MRFMIIRKADKNTEAGALPDPKILEAMVSYNESMARAGVFKVGEGLKPSSQSARVTFKNGKPVVTDGPFAETKELIAGFTMIEAGSMAEALEWVKRWPPEDVGAELEVRPLWELEELGARDIVDRARHRLGPTWK